jgi:transposase, IS5 family
MQGKRDTSQDGMEDLFRSRLTNIINMRHPLVHLSRLIDWDRLEPHFAPFYSEHGRPSHPVRLMVGLHLLKHIKGLSDEGVCAEWEENAYMQYFCGEEYFVHASPIARSDMTHFRARVGEEALEILLQESLAAAHRAGAISAKDTEDTVVDTTVQEKAIAHPTEHGLLLSAIEHLGEAATEAGVDLRQSYVRVAKLASIKTGRYIHAQQMKRAQRELKFLRTRLGRLIRDVYRKSESLAEKPESLIRALSKASRIHRQRRGDAQYLYAWHAPEVECISKGKARARYEFGCKVSIATNLKPAAGGHFILHAQALHGNPYDGHTLKDALKNLQQVIGRIPRRVAVDKGYRGHGLQHHPEVTVYVTGQKRGVDARIKRWLKRRAVVEPVIGHAKNDGLLGRNWLKGHAGDRINTTLAATGFNLRQLLRFLRLLWLYLLWQIRMASAPRNVQPNLKMAF